MSMVNETSSTMEVVFFGGFASTYVDGKLRIINNVNIHIIGFASTYVEGELNKATGTNVTVESFNSTYVEGEPVAKIGVARCQ